MAADNNLEQYALNDILEMQKANLASGVDVYVLCDRIPGYASNYGNWQDTRVGKIEYSTGSSITVTWESWGELDSGNVSTLNRFLDWGKEQSPDADNYALVMWDHGGGIVDCMNDDTSSSGIMPYQISDAINKSGLDISVVGFDACLMGMAEVVSCFDGVSDYLVASEEVEGGYGWNWTKFLSSLSGDMTSAEVASAAVDAAKNNSSITTLAAIKTDNQLTDELINFAQKSSNFTDYDMQILSMGFMNWSFDGVCIGQSRELIYNYADLMNVLNYACKQKNISQSLKNAIASLQATLDNVIINNHSNSEVQNNTCGVSFYAGVDINANYELYMPCLLDELKTTPLGKSSAWLTFIDNLFEAAVDVLYRKKTSIGKNTVTQVVTQNAKLNVKDIGAFSGGYYSLTGDTLLNLDKTDIYKFDLTWQGNENDAIKISLLDNPDGAFSVSLSNADNTEIISTIESTNGAITLSLHDLIADTYLLSISTSEWYAYNVEFVSDIVTGADYFDYTASNKNEKNTNGNGSISKATTILDGYYTGLATYSGDSDWYIYSARDNATNSIIVVGEGLTVAEYDAAGNLIQTAKYANGEYSMTMQSMNYLYVEGDANIDNNEVNSYSIAVNTVIGTASVVIQTIENLTANANEVSWDSSAASFNAELSKDGFENNLALSIDTTSISTYGMSNGNYQWRVQPDGSSEWTASESFAAAGNTLPQKFVASTDDSTDVFFANANGKWGAGYAAQHLGILNGWGGTNEQVELVGKNKLADIFEGSSDANVLVLTDDTNGDALFVDDIYTALPGTVAEQQARIAQIDEIRAGAGDDIADMTSQLFAYAGNGVTVYGGSGADTIWANNGENTLFGDAGADRIVGGSGNDVIIGGSGNDSMNGGGGDDIFCFGGDWGFDTVEQLAGGKVTLWFEDGDAGNWNSATMTYTDGANCVTVSGVANVTLMFGNDASLPDGAFADAASEKIFEDQNKGMLA